MTWISLYWREPGPTSEIPLSDFDPGPNTNHRWNVAMTAALTLQQTQAFTLLIDGDYSFDQQIVVSSPTLIRGVPGSVMRFTATGNAGFWMQKTSGGSSLTDLYLIGPAPFAGMDDDAFFINSSRSFYARMVITDFGGTALRCEGNALIDGTNANENKFAQIQVGLCGNSLAHQSGRNGAFWAHGGDSNGNMLLACDATDCRRGFWDESFLGNWFISCSVEACNDRFTKNPMDPTVGYGFGSTDANARTTLVACYIESDSQADVNYGSIWGGFCSSNRGTVPYTNNGLQNGYVGSLGPAGQFAMIGAGYASVPSDAMLTVGVGDERFYIVYDRVLMPDWFAFKYANADAGDVARWKGNPGANPSWWFPYGVQYGAAAKRVQYGSPGDAPTDGTNAWVVGDRLMEPAPAPTAVWGWVCTTAGTAGTAVWKALGTVAP